MSHEWIRDGRNVTAVLTGQIWYSKNSRYLPATRDLRRLDAVGHPASNRVKSMQFSMLAQSPRVCCFGLFWYIFIALFVFSIFSTVVFFVFSTCKELLHRFFEMFRQHFDLDAEPGSEKSYLQPFLRVDARGFHHPCHATAGQTEHLAGGKWLQRHSWKSLQVPQFANFGTSVLSRSNLSIRAWTGADKSGIQPSFQLDRHKVQTII